MMKQTLLILSLFLSGCYSRIHSGENTITGTQISAYRLLCVYFVHNKYGFPETAFVDSCNKFKIEDTIYITNKKP